MSTKKQDTTGNLVPRGKVVEAMKARGYATVTFGAKSIFERAGSGVVQIPVTDIIIEPARKADPKTGLLAHIVDAGTNNYAALAVAHELTIEFRECQEFANAVILRDARNIGE